MRSAPQKENIWFSLFILNYSHQGLSSCYFIFLYYRDPFPPSPAVLTTLWDDNRYEQIFCMTQRGFSAPAPLTICLADPVAPKRREKYK